jgi:hypothetical protein
MNIDIRRHYTIVFAHVHFRHWRLPRATPNLFHLTIREGMELYDPERTMNDFPSISRAMHCVFFTFQYCLSNLQTETLMVMKWSPLLRERYQRVHFASY